MLYVDSLLKLIEERLGRAERTATENAKRLDDVAERLTSLEARIVAVESAVEDLEHR